MSARKWCDKCGHAVAWRQGRSGKYYLAHVKVASSRTPEIVLRTPHSTLCEAYRAGRLGGINAAGIAAAQRAGTAQ